MNVTGDLREILRAARVAFENKPGSFNKLSSCRNIVAKSDVSKPETWVQILASWDVCHRSFSCSHMLYI